jgi:flagellin-like hook-associated protein FlgL
MSIFKKDIKYKYPGVENPELLKYIVSYNVNPAYCGNKEMLGIVEVSALGYSILSNISFTKFNGINGDSIYFISNAAGKNTLYVGEIAEEIYPELTNLGRFVITANLESLYPTSFLKKLNIIDEVKNPGNYAAVIYPNYKNMFLGKLANEVLSNKTLQKQYITSVHKLINSLDELRYFDVLNYYSNYLYLPVSKSTNKSKDPDSTSIFIPILNLHNRGMHDIIIGNSGMPTINKKLQKLLFEGYYYDLLWPSFNFSHPVLSNIYNNLMSNIINYYEFVIKNEATVDTIISKYYNFIKESSPRMARYSWSSLSASSGIINTLSGEALDTFYQHLSQFNTELGIEQNSAQTQNQATATLSLEPLSAPPGFIEETTNPVQEITLNWIDSPEMPTTGN